MLFPRPASDPITVGPYTLTQLIGQGGMAVVYKAKRQGPAGFEKTVVVKAMLPGLIQRKELVDLFRAEAKLSATLNHPNIVQVHDFGITEGVPYLVMEYLDGRNLTQMRTALQPTGGRLPIGAALAIARDVCHALAYAHDYVDSEGKRRQIIHRDVSPSNVMLCRDGMVKLLDFGVAKVAGQFDAEVTQSFRGKYAYMAPEQVNRQPIDRRVDVFACGTVLHEMLTGRRLFAAGSELETLERVSKAVVQLPSADNPDVPAKLDAIVKRALMREPAHRFASGREMAAALEELDSLAWSRKQLQSWLTGLFPDAFAGLCDVCGKSVFPGQECPECGTEAPGAADTFVAPEPMAGLPAMPSEPLPLPPLPAALTESARRTPPNLRVVPKAPESRQIADDFARPGKHEAMMAFPPPDQGSFEPLPLGEPKKAAAADAEAMLDRTPVDPPKPLTATVPEARPKLATPVPPPLAGAPVPPFAAPVPPPLAGAPVPPFAAPVPPPFAAAPVPPPFAAPVPPSAVASAPGATSASSPRLFVVPRAAKDDSVRMGIHGEPTAPEVVPGALLPSLAESGAPTPPTGVRQLPPPAQQPTPPTGVRHVPQPVFVTGPQLAPMLTPDLRKKTPLYVWFVLGGLLALGGIGLVVAMQPRENVEAAAPALASPAQETPAEVPAPSLPQKARALEVPPVPDQPRPPASALLDPPRPPAPRFATPPVTVTARSPEPSAAPSRSHARPHRRPSERPQEAPAPPRGSVKDGRIVDPFDGSE